MGLMKWVTNTTGENSNNKGGLFQATWMLLHLFALLNCIAVVLHLLSAVYHGRRIVSHAPASPHTDTDSHRTAG